MFYAFSTHWDLTGITEQESGCIPSHQYTSGVVTFLLSWESTCAWLYLLLSIFFCSLYIDTSVSVFLPLKLFCSSLSSTEWMALTGHWLRDEIHQTKLKNPMISCLLWLVVWTLGKLVDANHTWTIIISKVLELQHLLLFVQKPHLFSAYFFSCLLINTDLFVRASPWI